MKKFHIPSLPPTTPKSIRFPNNLIDEIEKSIVNKNCTFSAFVIAAVQNAIDDIKDEDEKNETLSLYPLSAYHLYLYANLPRISFFAAAAAAADLGAACIRCQHLGRTGQNDCRTFCPRPPLRVREIPKRGGSLIHQIADLDRTDPETVRQELLLYLTLALADPAYRDYLRQIPCLDDPEALIRLAADYAASNPV